MFAQRPTWSVVEYQYLVNWYQKLTVKQLAGDLRKPEKEIQNQIDKIKKFDSDICAAITFGEPYHNEIDCSLADSIIDRLNVLKGTSALRKRIQTMYDKYGSNKPSTSKNRYQTLKKGRKEDLGVFVRSGWEANILRWLTYQQRGWVFEPKVFVFEGIKRGTMTYMPDIYLPEEDIWIEVKGHLEAQDKTRIRRFKKFFPQEYSNLRAIVGTKGTKADEFFCSMEVPILAYYNEIKKEFKNKIEHWE